MSVLLHSAKSFCAIISLAVFFGLLELAYSFFGFLNKTQNIVSLKVFRSLTVNEIGEHLLFGVIASIPLRNIKASILLGLMALTIDLIIYSTLSDFIFNPEWIILVLLLQCLQF
jgi:hypothetical protein